MVALKIWIDAITPKQLLLFRRIASRLEKKGADVYITSRNYHDTNYLVERLGMNVKSIGSHGGIDKRGKLEASLNRSLQLLEFVTENKPDFCISFSSPEAARVSTGLGISHYSVNDSPHSVWVAKLTLPLSELLFYPWVIPSSAWLSYGIRRSNLFAYKALDPAAWLKDRASWPKPNYIEDSAKGCIIYRPTEYMASYIDSSNYDIDLIRLLSERFPDDRIIILARYGEEATRYRDVSAMNVSVVDSPFFGPNILQHAKLLIGGGGTMNAEAALLGIPVISVYPGGATYVDKYLISKGLLVRAKDSKDAVKKAFDILADTEKIRENRTKSAKELESMDDPSEVVANKVLVHFRSVKSHR
ncbi:MAG: DUF354 domain-containing protein [Conexivisphaerales archaeon]